MNAYPFFMVKSLILPNFSKALSSFSDLVRLSKPDTYTWFFLDDKGDKGLGDDGI